MTFRPSAPTRAQRIVWPNDFGQRFTVFVDTEEEFDWSAPFDRAQRGVTASVAIPDAARRFADHGVSLTFLADHPIVTAQQSIDALRRAVTDHGAAVGAQLHPWVNPPHEEAVTARNSFVGNLPPALQAAKIDELGRAIEAAFGRAPTTFRAGRYGLGDDTLRLLAARGYRIDSSVRAHYSYAGEGGPDYAHVGAAAYATGHDRLVELPFTTIYTGALRRLGPGLYPMARRVRRGTGALARARLLNRVSLTPEGMPVDEVLEAMAVALGEGLPLLSFAFHSPTLVPGHTPYTRDAAALAAFWQWWDTVLSNLSRRGVRPIGEAELIAALDRVLLR